MNLCNLQQFLQTNCESDWRILVWSLWVNAFVIEFLQSRLWACFNLSKLVASSSFACSGTSASFWTGVNPFSIAHFAAPAPTRTEGGTLPSSCDGDCDGGGVEYDCEWEGECAGASVCGASSARATSVGFWREQSAPTAAKRSDQPHIADASHSTRPSTVRLLPIPARTHIQQTTANY